MREYLVTVLLAAIITYLITPFVRDLAIKSGAIAQIRSRDVHVEPTPRWGGLAMWLAMALTLVIVNYLPLVEKSFGREATGIFLSGTFILFIGMLDDRFDLDPITKFAGQALSAGILLIYGVQILWLPINGITTLPTNIGQLLTVLFVMVVINAINFVDGLDGLATGIVMICAASFFAFSYLLAVVNGLLPLLLPFSILAIPLLDFVMAIVRRVKAGRSPFDADREHLHHRIMRLGLTQQRTTIILYLWTAMFALPTVIAAFTPIWVAFLAGTVIFGVSILLVKFRQEIKI